LQTNLDQGFFIELDMNGRIKTVHSNPIKTLTFTKNDYLMHYIADNSYEKFLKFFEHTKQHDFSFGGLINFTINNHPKEMTVSFLKKDQSIMVVGLIEPPESVAILNEIIKLNNQQATAIREKMQETSALKNDSLIFEQLSKLNSDLVNAKRTLEQKNQELNKLNKRLEEITQEDMLTGIKNRRAFFSTYQDYDTNVDKVLLLIDFNHFKKVNDTYGHHRGDEALIYFANRLNDCMNDHVGDAFRLGGDEFLLITDHDGYDEFLKSFDLILEDLKAYHEALSLSYGMVEIPKHTVLNEKALKNYLKEADTLMYAMKKDRR